jgi:hypothetical protein
MAGNKTKVTEVSVTEFLSQVEPERRREDAQRLDGIFREVSGFAPRMWGPSMIGYGRYHYKYKSGREGDSLATGFAPRKANLVVYILPGYTDFSAILSRLGKHKIGKSCLYINKLDDIDIGVLKELVAAGIEDLNKHWPVEPT